MPIVNLSSDDDWRELRGMDISRFERSLRDMIDYQGVSAWTTSSINVTWGDPNTSGTRAYRYGPPVEADDAHRLHREAEMFRGDVWSGSFEAHDPLLGDEHLVEPVDVLSDLLDEIYSMVRDSSEEGRESLRLVFLDWLVLMMKLIEPRQDRKPMVRKIR